VVHDVLELMAARAGEADVQLESILDKALPELMFDAEMLHRAVLNVVTNAIDACERRQLGKVTVRTDLDTETNRLQIIVEDNGEGISEKDLEKVFSVFESRKGSRGTGLGLPVSQKILREHGGDIEVESTLGKGSRFVLSFPALRATATTFGGNGLTGSIQIPVGMTRDDGPREPGHDE
jgi:signal transduction histidine kinase